MAARAPKDFFMAARAPKEIFMAARAPKDFFMAARAPKDILMTAPVRNIWPFWAGFWVFLGAFLGLSWARI